MAPASQLSKGLGPLLMEKKFKSPQFCNPQLSVYFPLTATKIIPLEDLSMKINAVNPAVGFLPSKLRRSIDVLQRYSTKILALIFSITLLLVGVENC